MIIIYFIIYNGLFHPLIFLIAMLVSIFQKKLRRSMRGKFRATKKLNKYLIQIDPNLDIYWFHASSLGEFYQLKTVIEKLKDDQKDLSIIVSFSSPSGYDHATSRAMDFKFYIPYDFPWTIYRMLNLMKPKKIMFASYDLWPNVIWIAYLMRIHVNIFSVNNK